jgi:two-component system, cell cycle response regulator DivK
MKRLLVIEDNATNRKLLGDILRLKGFEVEEAEDALLGLELAMVGEFDLVLMDIQLPGMDGLEATRRLRADPRTQGIPIIAVTAHAMKGDEQRIMESGCDAYVTKPIAYKEFLLTLNGLLQNGRT